MMKGMNKMKGMTKGMMKGMMKGMNKSMKKGMNKAKSMYGGMETMTGTMSSSSQNGGKTRKHKVNNVLRAWRMHVQKVAKEENVSYGKEAMQMAKKGKHGQEWARIKMSMKKQKGGELMGDLKDIKIGMTSTDDRVDIDESANNGNMPMPDNETGNSNSDTDSSSNMDIEGGRRRKSRRNKRRMSRKSRKH